MIIEEGKRYVRRDGSVSGFIYKVTNGMFCWGDGDFAYTLAGRWASDHYETSNDLTSEYKEPEMKEMKEVDFEKPLRFVDNADELKYIGLDSCGFHVVEIVPVNILIQIDRYGKSSRWQDVENIPEKLVRWVNLYEGGAGAAHITHELADQNAGIGRIACIRIEFEEGEGL